MGLRCRGLAHREAAALPPDTSSSQEGPHTRHLALPWSSHRSPHTHTHALSSARPHACPKSVLCKQSEALPWTRQS